jgi:5-deoxy-glucuronate isomerase
MRYLDFARLQLERGAHYGHSTGEREYVLDFFAGTAAVGVKRRGGREEVFGNVGSRADVFSGPPVMMYIPPHAGFHIEATSPHLEVGIFSAPSEATVEPKVIEGGQVTAKVVGKDNWQRTVYSVLAENVPAERLLAGETLNPPGNWSSYPPHKHDQPNPPQEAVLEEIYFFRFRPAQGYGFIYTYTAPGDPQGFSDVYVVEDGDTILLPKGYHPVVAAPGYELHYTWVLAGEERRYGAWADDPRHAWVKER